MKDVIIKGIINVHDVLVDNYRIQETIYQGRDHLIVPVVMMVEGVHHGSRGPLLYPAEELEATVNAWNGMPIVLNHPEMDGHNVSARSPDTALVGTVFNVYMDGTKLKAEAWIDVTALAGVDGDALQRIRDCRPMNVSVGIFSDEQDTQGDWNNEDYRAIARNQRPDHLALLPNDTGACSIDDGCGLRNNKINSDTKQEGGLMSEDKNKNKELNVQNRLTVNEPGFHEISRSIQNKMDAMDTDSRFHFLEEVFDDYFIYRVANRETNDSAFYKRTYQVNSDSGEVEIQDSATEVRKNVTFETVQNNKLKRKSNLNKTKMERKNASPCKIDALIANDATKFTEDDREWLATLEEDKLEQLVPNEVKKEDPPAKVETPAATTNQVEKDPPPEITKEDVQRILNEEKDPEKFINDFMPEGLRDQMKSGHKMYQDKRAKLIEDIAANSKFTEDKLKNWSTADLEDLRDSVAEKSDYSLSSEGIVNTKGASKEMKTMLNFQEVKKEDK